MKIEGKKPRRVFLPIPGLPNWFAAADGTIKHGKNQMAVRESEQGTAIVRFRAIEFHHDNTAEPTTVELSVAVLVARTHIGQPPPGFMRFPAHRNGNRMDCSEENLEYVRDEDAEFDFYDRMMRDPGFPLNQGRGRFTVWR